MSNNQHKRQLRRLMASVSMSILILATLACNRSRGDIQQTNSGAQPTAALVEEQVDEPTADAAADEIEATLDELLDQLEGDDSLDDMDF